MVLARPDRPRPGSTVGWRTTGHRPPGRARYQPHEWEVSRCSVCVAVSHSPESRAPVARPNVRASRATDSSAARPAVASYSLFQAPDHLEQGSVTRELAAVRLRVDLQVRSGGVSHGGQDDDESVWEQAPGSAGGSGRSCSVRTPYPSRPFRRPASHRRRHRVLIGLLVPDLERDPLLVHDRETESTLGRDDDLTPPPVDRQGRPDDDLGPAVPGNDLEAGDDPPTVQRAVEQSILAERVVLLLGEVAHVEGLPRSSGSARRPGRARPPSDRRERSSRPPS